MENEQPPDDFFQLADKLIKQMGEVVQNYETIETHGDSTAEKDKQLHKAVSLNGQLLMILIKCVGTLIERSNHTQNELATIGGRLDRIEQTLKLTPYNPNPTGQLFPR